MTGNALQMSPPAPANKAMRVECAASSGFEAWLAGAEGALILTTYQAGKVAVIGSDGRQVVLLMRQFDKPLGLALMGEQMVLATRYDVTIFANAPALAWEYESSEPGKYDVLYLPRMTYHTGDINTHDLAVSDDGVYFVATRFSCLARLSDEFSFLPVWKPDFVTDLVPEDRCHLNGMAMRDGQPRYVTAHGRTNSPGGWREGKATGGVLIDVATQEIISDKLVMPHTPRWHDGRLWVLNSGEGELLIVDPDTGRRECVCRLPGYLRGLSFTGDYALIGMSKIRERHIFGGLPVQERHEQLYCGVAVIDLRSGETVGILQFSSGCEELFSVEFLPGCRRPMILNLERPESRQAISNPQSSFWLRPENEIRESTESTTIN